MSNFIQVSNTKLEELKNKIDALPSSINNNDAAYHVHNSKTSAQHLHDVSQVLENNLKGDIDSINTQLATGISIQGDYQGTPEKIKSDGNGNLLAQIINTVSCHPFRKDIASGATNSHAKVNDDGHLQVKSFEENKVIGSDTVAGLASQTAEGQLISASNYSALGIVGSSSNSSDPVVLQVKAAGTFYDYKEYFPSSSGTFYFDVYPLTFANYRVIQRDTTASNFTLSYGFGRS